MKKLLVLALSVALTRAAAAKVWVSVYQHDGKTPLAAVDADHPNVYGDIMVGTRLTFIIRSDSSAFFYGTLRLSWNDAPYAKLSGRGPIPPPPGSLVKHFTFKDSVLNAAGTQAYVRDTANSSGIGLVVRSDGGSYATGGGHAAYPGDWFVVDYHAEQVGVCTVGLYGLTSTTVPIQALSFTQVPSRDFNHDTVVTFPDFVRLAAHWQAAVDPDSSEVVALDLNADGRVDVADLAAFSRRWLERIDSPVLPPPVKVFAEGWEGAAAQVYTLGSTIKSDAWSWRVANTVSPLDCGPSPQRAEILADNGHHALQLRSVESNSDCEDDVGVSLQEINGTNVELNIPLMPDTVLSFKEIGELTDPPGRGLGQDCTYPPCFNNISLILKDNNGNNLAYVLQRPAGAVANVPNSRLGDRYREIFLDPDAGSYRRSLWADFQTIPAFNPANAKIIYIEFRVDEHGSAILDDLVIGPPAPADPNSGPPAGADPAAQL